MKLQNNPVSTPRPNVLENGLKVAFIAVAAFVVGSIPVVFSNTIANSPANNPALYGESGLWSALSQK
ncbi:hypothetical protein [Myxacorys almedinensis]|uniref:Uncharacterized protein n=1 Tax=Myxacorys almedinensis A TaxID=2690445 RepID=A0A8J7Z859_9CYAN|nr:hypothetical protein [Myxacorys almedinensis]NDJ18148.1 hypothetical protein [Myxacorys almedinensis A]